MSPKTDSNDETSPDFWTWSLNHYQQKTVSNVLLKLQDGAGLNVNLLLWCLWCAKPYEELPQLVLRKAHDLTSRWSADLAINLRQVRRALKSPPKQANAEKAKTLRDVIKKAELSAEEIEQLMLENLARENLKLTNDIVGYEQRARRNLVNYASLSGASHHEGFSVGHLESLVESISGDVDGSDQ